MTSLLKAADHLQIIGLTQTRRSPVNFLPSVINTSGTPTGLTEPVIVPSGTGTPTNLTGVGIAEAQQVYSKKARILEQNKNTISAIATSSNSSTIINNGNASSTNFRDNRDYEMTVERDRDRIEEQQSPLVKINTIPFTESNCYTWRKLIGRAPTYKYWACDVEINWCYL